MSCLCSVLLPSQLLVDGGFMFWGMTLQLTEPGVPASGQLLVAAHTALGVVAGMSEGARAASYEELQQVKRRGVMPSALASSCAMRSMPYLASPL
jgi:hypothetical protein